MFINMFKYIYMWMYIHISTEIFVNTSLHGWPTGGQNQQPQMVPGIGLGNFPGNTPYPPVMTNIAIKTGDF